MKKLGGSAPRTHLLAQPPLFLPEDSHWANVQHFLSPSWGKIIRAVSFSTTSQEPDLFAELVRSSRVEQEAQEDQGHHEANGVPYLKIKNYDHSPHKPSYSQEKEKQPSYDTTPT